MVARGHWNGWLYVIEPADVAPRFSSDVRCGPIADVNEIAQSRHEEIRRQAWTKDPDTLVFGAWVGGELAAVCWYQARETHRRRGGFFRLSEDEAELAQITTAPAFRGRGIGSELIQYGVQQMGALGFRRLYAKIWRDNVASLRAFERAGWHVQKRFIAVRLRGWQTPLVIAVPGRRS